MSPWYNWLFFRDRRTRWTWCFLRKHKVKDFTLNALNLRKKRCLCFLRQTCEYFLFFLMHLACYLFHLLSSVAKNRKFSRSWLSRSQQHFIHSYSQTTHKKSSTLSLLYKKLSTLSVHSPLPSVIHIGDADVPFVSSVKNLGVTLDSNHSMSQHISNTCKAAYIQIRHI